MNIDSKTVEHIAKLARLELDTDSKANMEKDLSRIITFVEKLNELNTDGVEPLIYMTPETNVLRQDNVEVTITQAEALKNAPQKDSDYIKVPKVLGERAAE